MSGRATSAILFLSLGANVALAVVLWGRPTGASDEALRALRAEVESLRTEVERRPPQAVATPAAARSTPTLAAADPARTVPAAAPAGAPDPAPAAAPAVPPVASAPPRRVTPEEARTAAEWSKRWLDDAQQVRDAGLRKRTLEEMRDALTGSDDAKRLAALRAYRWLGNTVAYDREEVRRLVLPLAQGEPSDLRRAAREALVWTSPNPDDLPLWLEEARTADRNDAETTVFNLVRLAGGPVEGEVADAVLHLLRDGTDIRKAFVMRGLQSATRFDPRVEARLLEIVRGADAQSYDSSYFFHFLTPRWDPKSDAVVDLLLERTAAGKGEVESVTRGFQSGLSETQRRRVSTELTTYVENAGTEYVRRAVAQALVHVAGREVAPRLETLAANPALEEGTRRLLLQAVKAAQSRP